MLKYRKETRIMFKNVILIHGIGGLNKEEYFPHFKKTCEALGLKTYMPSLGNYHENTSYELWKAYFDNNFKSILNNETIIIAQSIGTQFIIKYLCERNIQIGTYISCAGPKDVLNLREEAKERGKGFTPTARLFKPSEEEFARFKNFTFPKFSLFCDNDTFFEQKNLEEYSKAINSKPMLIKGKAHFQVEVLNELEDLIKELINQ